MTFSGEALYQIRLRRNMSRADLAHAVRRSSDGQIKATERGVRGWEKGEYVPRGDAVPALASALTCEVTELYATKQNGNSPADDDEEADLMAALANVLRRFVRLAVNDNEPNGFPAKKAPLGSPINLGG